jgi:hypothetical protein
VRDVAADCRAALVAAAAGRWEEAHGFVQRHEGESLADWIHAVVHKVEGDLSNSRYWYRRAGRLAHVDDEPTAELEAIRAELV